MADSRDGLSPEVSRLLEQFNYLKQRMRQSRTGFGTYEQQQELKGLMDRIQTQMRVDETNRFKEKMQAERRAQEAAKAQEAARYSAEQQAQERLNYQERRRLELRQMVFDNVTNAKHVLKDVEGKMCLNSEFKPFMYITARAIQDASGTLYFVLNTTSPTGEPHKSTTGIKVPITGNALPQRIATSISRLRDARTRWLQLMGELSLNQ